MKKLLFITSIIGLSALTSCTSLLDFQTARTVKKGNNELIVSATSTNIENDEGHTTPFVAPMVGFTRGMGEKIDLGINVQPFGLAAIHSKYQFYGDQKSKLSFSALGRLGYIYSAGKGLNEEHYVGYSHSNNVFSIVEGNEVLKSNLSDIYTEASIIGSYFIDKNMSVTSSLKMIYHPIYGVYTMGNTYGFEVGKKVKFSFQAGYNFYWEDRYAQKGFMVGRWQYGFGVKKMLKFGHKEEEEPKTLN